MHFKNYFLLLLFSIGLTQHISAHNPNQSYIFLKIYQDSVAGLYEITANDLNKVFDWNLDKHATFEDFKPHLPAITDFVKENIGFSSKAGAHPIQFGEIKEIYDSEGFGSFIQVPFTLDNLADIPKEINIKSTGVFEQDKTHRTLVAIPYNFKAGIMVREGIVALTFSPDDTEQTLDLTSNSIWRGVRMMIESGIHHIFIGIDHILFLIALILPGVVYRLKREEKNGNNIEPVAYSNSFGKWTPVEKFRPAIIYVLKIITFFTIAHSITLSVAALGYFNLSARIVESIIALSIALAAFHNIRPLFKRDWIIAFVFGLFHGFGFASVLGEVGLAGDYMGWSLFGFNVGVELGQIAIIAVVFPILYLIRRFKLYPYILVYGSIALIFISIYWFLERAFEVDIPLGAILGL